VLGRFDSTEAGLVDKVLAAACDQAECWLNAGIQKAMSQFNGVIEGPETKREEAK
jgi:peptidyl-tRNA hydrolase